jgi:pimeloyl-ACP methyl ester carboxylesterase
VNRESLKKALRTIWILSGLSFMVWIAVGFQATGLPPSTFANSSTVRVEALADGGWRFAPTAAALGPELVFMPGGMVEPAAYAPLLRTIAAGGFRARLLPLPWRCACTESQRADLFSAIDREAQAAKIVLAGHSRGAMLAARYAREHPKNLAALVLMATTHPRDFSLSESPFPIVKVYGTSDGVASYGAMQANAHLLPTAAHWVRIEGGNHVQFGFYRHQLMSGTATISRAEQQAQLTGALLAVLREAAKR